MADAPRFQQHDAGALLGQMQRRRKPGGTAADDGDIGLAIASQRGVGRRGVGRRCIPALVEGEAVFHTFSSKWSRSQLLITPWKASSSAALMEVKLRKK